MAITHSIDLGDGIVVAVVSHDPTVVTTDALKGSLVFEKSTGLIFVKTDDGATTNVKKLWGDAGQIFAGVGETVLDDVANLKVNLAAVTNPAVSNDNTEGYAVGSRWINVTLDKEFVAVDVSTGAAVWVETTGAGGGTHASSHSDGGADEVTVENLATASVDVSAALRPDGIGGLAFSDVNHGDLTGVTADQHHAQDHATRHSDGGADEVTVENLAATSVDVSTALRPDGIGGLAFSDVGHGDLTGVTADQHHAQDHATRHSDGGADEVTVENLAATSVDVSTALRPDGVGGLAFSDVGHGDLTGVTADQHHNQSHAFAGADHTASTLATVNSKISDGTVVETLDSRFDGFFCKLSAEGAVAVFAGLPDGFYPEWDATDAESYLQIDATVAFDKGGIVQTFVVPNGVTAITEVEVTGKLSIASATAINVRVFDTAGVQVATGSITAATKTTLSLTSFSPTPTLTPGGMIRVEIEGHITSIGESAFLGTTVVQFDRT